MESEILISAYACDPNNPSEPVAGWAFFMAALNISKPGQKIHLLSRKVLADCIRENIPESRKKDVELHLLSLPKILNFLEKPGVGIGARIAYILWNQISKKYLRQQIWTKKLQVAHHVTLATEIFPNPISVLPNSVLKIWGPIGSSGNPKIYLLRPFRLNNFQGAFLQYTRNLLAPNLGRFFGKNIDLVLCQTLETQKIFARTPGKAVYFTNEFVNLDLANLEGIGRGKFPDLLEESHSDKIKIVVVGNWTPRKRIDIALNFISSLSQDDRFSLTVIGCPKSITKSDFFAKFGRDKKIPPANAHFTGKLTRQETIKLMASMDVMFHPSAREGASFAVGEAISLGLPVVCFEGTGAADLVVNVKNSGIVVRPDSKSLKVLGEIFIAASKIQNKSSDCWSIHRIEKFLQETYQI